MSKEQFTPGPWKRNHLTIRAEINGVHVAEVSEPHRLIKGSERRDDMEFCRGNARLIASAPCLLAALQKICDKAKDMDNYWVIMDEVDDGLNAIKKALGKE